MRPVAPMRALSTLKAENPNKINTMVDLESDKVVTIEKLEAGKKKVYCRCWLSGTFPLCDGTHAKHNEATGDNVGPLIISPLSSIVLIRVSTSSLVPPLGK